MPKTFTGTFKHPGSETAVSLEFDDHTEVDALMSGRMQSLVDSQLADVNAHSIKFFVNEDEWAIVKRN